MPTSRREKLAFGVGVVLAVLGGALLVSFGVSYVTPYRRVRNMELGHCVVTAKAVAEKPVTCMCRADDTSSCRSHYPCVRIWVNFTTGAGHLIPNVTLYDSYDTFLLQKDAIQCSYHKCKRLEQKNVDAVKEFTTHRGQEGQSYDCYYNPEDTTYVIWQIVSKATVVHSMLWSSLALVTGLAILCAFIFNVGPFVYLKRKNTANLESFRTRVGYDKRYQLVTT